MQVHIKDIMSSELTTVSADSSVEQTETIMLSTNRRCVPVVDEIGNCVGVLSHSDILRVRNAKQDVASVAVRDIMSRHIISVSPHCSVDDAMELMIENGIHHVLVIMNKKVSGMESVTDTIQDDKARTYNPFAEADSFVPAQ